MSLLRHEEHERQLAKFNEVKQSYFDPNDKMTTVEMISQYQKKLKSKSRKPDYL
jgi:hypothetical protein